MASQFKRYNLFWQKTVDPASLELDMIKHGGQWTKQNGEIAGEGLFYHYKEFIRIVWPWVVQHKWFDLILKNYLTHRTIVLIGPASSGKTFMSALCVLVDYFAHPDCTTVICCSTTKERLQDRVWADVTKLFREAKRQYHWLPGNVIEGRLRIVTDSRKDSPDGRDFRNGCFPTGTLVDTPAGKVPIESLKAGDLVFNAIGVGRIKETHTRTSDKLLQITLNDGRQIECTEEHPFFTSRGWVKAIDLETFEMVLSGHETMRLVRKESGRSVPEQEILLTRLPDLSGHGGMSAMRGKIPTIKETAWKLQSSFLRTDVRFPLDIKEQSSDDEADKGVQELWKNHASSSPQSGLLLSSLPGKAADNAMQAMRQILPINKGVSIKTTLSFLREVLQEESDWEAFLKEESDSNSARNGGLENIPNLNPASSYSDQSHYQTQPQTLVSGGLGISRYKTRSGNRRWDSPNSREGCKGQGKDSHPAISWVESVAVLEQGSGAGFDASEKHFRLR